MLAQRDVIGVTAAAALAALELMGRSRALIGLGKPRHPAQHPQRGLQPGLEREAGFRKARQGPFPVRVRQHRVAEQVGERGPGDGHAEFVGVGPIGLDAFPRFVHLGEKHLLGRTMSAQPVARAALKRAQRPAVEFPRQCSQQVIEERLGLHFRADREPALGFGPDLGQRVGARAPRVRLCAGLRAEVRRQILPGRLPVHAGLHRGVTGRAVQLMFVH